MRPTRLAHGKYGVSCHMPPPQQQTRTIRRRCGRSRPAEKNANRRHRRLYTLNLTSQLLDTLLPLSLLTSHHVTRVADLTKHHATHPCPRYFCYLGRRPRRGRPCASPWTQPTRRHLFLPRFIKVKTQREGVKLGTEWNGVF